MPNHVIPTGLLNIDFKSVVVCGIDKPFLNIFIKLVNSCIGHIANEAYVAVNDFMGQSLGSDSNFVKSKAQVKKNCIISLDLKIYCMKRCKVKRFCGG